MTKEYPDVFRKDELNSELVIRRLYEMEVRKFIQARPKKGKKGRVSYQLLSINQLGAVYEALLSYRGFFATEDLYEVQPAPKKATKAASTDEGIEAHRGTARCVEVGQGLMEFGEL